MLKPGNEIILLEEAVWLLTREIGHELSKPTAAQCQPNLDGVLLGTAVGDALGLPAENLSPRRARRLWRGDLQMRFLFGRGMMSDDTEHTLMVAQALLSNPTDTVGAIVGALCGASRGSANIPHEWLDAVLEWPRSTAFIKTLARKLAEQKRCSRPVGEVGYFWPGLILRNLIFLSAVIVHGFRRLLPPY